MKIEKVSSLDEILNCQKMVRDKKMNFYTNFFFDSIKHSIWISEGLLYTVNLDQTVFLIRKNNGFINLFFISANLDNLALSLNKFIKNKSGDRIVVDLVSISKDDSGIYELFVEEGFVSYRNLFRMSRSVSGYNDFSASGVQNALSKDAGEIKLLLETHFDKYSEQIPLFPEIEQWITNGTVLIFKENDQIGGFLIYERNGKTAYLRYWFVHPDFRNKKVGSALINTFFSFTQDTKRQLFWVIEDNENAIKRYKHYGFEEEKMVDCILIK